MAKPKKQETQTELSDSAKAMIGQSLETCKTADGYDMQKFMNAVRSSMSAEDFAKFEGSIARSMAPEGFFGYAKATWSGEGVMPKVVTVAQLTGAVTLISIGLEGVGAVLDIEQIRILSFVARKLLGD